MCLAPLSWDDYSEKMEKASLFRAYCFFSNTASCLASNLNTTRNCSGTYCGDSTCARCRATLILRLLKCSIWGTCMSYFSILHRILYTINGTGLTFPDRLFSCSYSTTLTWSCIPIYCYCFRNAWNLLGNSILCKKCHSNSSKSFFCTRRYNINHINIF